MRRGRRLINWWDGLPTAEKDTYASRAVVVGLFAVIVYVFWGNLTGEGR